MVSCRDPTFPYGGALGVPHSPCAVPSPKTTRVHEPFFLSPPTPTPPPPQSRLGPELMGLGSGLFPCASPSRGPEQELSGQPHPAGPSQPAFPGPVDALEFVNVCREALCPGPAVRVQVRPAPGQRARGRSFRELAPAHA